jgi:hypothetical protein
MRHPMLTDLLSTTERGRNTLCVTTATLSIDL